MCLRLGPRRRSWVSRNRRLLMSDVDLLVDLQLATQKFYQPRERRLNSCLLQTFPLNVPVRWQTLENLRKCKILIPLFPLTHVVELTNRIREPIHEETDLRKT